jgi:hypothetical protein
MAVTLQALSLISDAVDTAPSASPSPSSLLAVELTAEFYWPEATKTTSKAKHQVGSKWMLTAVAVRFQF